MMRMSPGEAFRAGLARAATLPERWQAGVAYNPFTRRTADDPYPGYAALRERSPVHRSRLLGAWVVSRYADVDAILRDHRRFGTDPRKAALPRRQRRRLPPEHELTMLTLDPPDHTRLRALVSQAFTRSRVHALEGRIRRVVAELLDAIDDPAGFDLMAAVARPLPAIVIAEILGIPAADRDRFIRWADQRARLFEPTVSRRERRLAGRASRECNAYLTGIIARRRREPRDDLLSALVHAEAAGERLSGQELLNMVRMLIVAGTETTTNLIGNGMLALLRHPAELAWLRADPGCIPRAVEELLRYDAPVQATFRRALADCEVNGATVRRRDTVVVLLGAANRDPAVFDDPDRLDVARDGRAHVALGRGIHHCLGTMLARLEGRIVLEMLLARFAPIELAGPRPRFHRNLVLRGLRSLPLRCTGT